jgi:hypothetical protein
MRLKRRPRHVRAHRQRMSHRRRRGHRQSDRLDYKTPYAIHITGGVQHAFNEHWLVSADYTHEQGNHGYRAFPYTSGTNVLTPLIPASDPTMPPIRQT